MNANTCTMPTTIPLHRPLWQRWTDGLRERLSAWRSIRSAEAGEMDLQLAIELNDATLRDIGAPEWLQAEAAARRGGDSLALRAARADLAGGGLRWHG
jgi:hypothetical protein